MSIYAHIIKCIIAITTLNRLLSIKTNESNKISFKFAFAYSFCDVFSSRRFRFLIYITFFVSKKLNQQFLQARSIRHKFPQSLSKEVFMPHSVMNDAQDIEFYGPFFSGCFKSFTPFSVLVCFLGSCKSYLSFPGVLLTFFYKIIAFIFDFLRLEYNIFMSKKFF